MVTSAWCRDSSVPPRLSANEAVTEASDNAATRPTQRPLTVVPAFRDYADHPAEELTIYFQPVN